MQQREHSSPRIEQRRVVADSRINRPVFVLCAARSGSTLLRFILDSHPDLACPPESNFASVLSSAEHMLRAMGLDNGIPEDQLLIGIRCWIEDAVGDFLRGAGKSRWCDKSLINYSHSEALLRLWPDAKMICLHRHCMDFIKSGIEASPFGFNAYGFEPYIRGSLENTVAGLASYWVDHTRALLDFEEAHPTSSCSVRYEDMVSAPQMIATGLWQFLDVNDSADVIEQMFSMEHLREGPSDYEIWSRNEISTASVGTGLAIPGNGIPPKLRDVVNQLLVRLDYTPIDDYWGRVERPPESRPDAPVNDADSRFRLIVLEGTEIIFRATYLLNDPHPIREESEAACQRPAIVLDRRYLATLASRSDNFRNLMHIGQIRYYPAPSWSDNLTREERQLALQLRNQIVEVAEVLLSNPALSCLYDGDLSLSP